MITEAERRFPVRIRVALPAGGFGQHLGGIYAWLDENCGADGWAMTPAGMRGLVVNDAVAIYFPDTTLASAFVARWCAGQKPETEHGAFRFREDAPMPRRVAVPHKSPPKVAAVAQHRRTARLAGALSHRHVAIMADENLTPDERTNGES